MLNKILFITYGDATQAATWSNVPYFAGPRGTTSPDGFVGGNITGFVPSVLSEQTLFLIAANFRL